MKAILERSGVPPGTFYAYFEDRDAAVERLAFSYVEAATQMLAGWAANDAAGSWEESIVDLVRTYRRWALARPAFVRLWTAGQLGGALVEYEQSTNVYLATLLRSALERVEPDSELPEVVVRFTVELIDQMMRFAFREADADRFRVVEEELITAVIRYLGVHLPATADRIGRSSAGS